MFGIQSFILKIFMIVITGIVVICIATVVGCTPNSGTELKQSQLALATKNNVDASKEDNRQDNSIEFVLPDVSEQALPPTDSNADETVKLVKARALEREKVLLAEGRVKEMEIRASEEKWRILVWVVGIGAFLLAIAALYIRSPLDRKGRE